MILRCFRATGGLAESSLKLTVFQSYRATHNPLRSSLIRLCRLPSLRCKVRIIATSIMTYRDCYRWGKEMNVDTTRVRIV